MDAFFKRRYEFYIGFALAFLVACAEPKYIKEAPSDVISEWTTDDSGAGKDCQIFFERSKHCLDWAWVTVPTEKDMGSLIFKVHRPNQLDGSPVVVDVGTDVRVILWMPSMAHGSVPTQVEQKDLGSFIVHNVFFIMPGDWEIRFHIYKDNKVVDEAVVRLFI